MKKIVMSVLGLVLVLGWWTLRDRMGLDTSESASARKIPAKVWEGGGGAVTIEAQNTETASVVVVFESSGSPGDKDHRFLEAWEQIAPGQHTFTIEVPPRTGGSAAVLFHDTSVAKVGSKLSVRVLVNGAVVGEESDTLDQPLAPGYGMQVEVDLADWATGKQEE